MNKIENVFFKNLNLRNKLQLDSLKNKDDIFKTNIKTCIIKNLLQGKENIDCIHSGFSCEDEENHKKLTKEVINEFNKNLKQIKLINLRSYSYSKYMDVEYSSIPTEEIGLSDNEKEKLILESEKLFESNKKHLLTRQEIWDTKESLEDFSTVCSNLSTGTNEFNKLEKEKSYIFFNNILQKYKLLKNNNNSNIKSKI